MSVRRTAVCLFSIALTFVAVTAMAQFKNIRLAKEEEGIYPPVEPSIAINHKNPQNIVAGVVLNRAIYTLDGGATWNETKLESPYGVYGDPALVSDVRGDFYYFHLANPGSSESEGWLERIVCQKSTDGGKTWSSGTSIGYNPPKDMDKAWPAVDPNSDQLCVTWTQFDKYGLKDSNWGKSIFKSYFLRAFKTSSALFLTFESESLN